MKIRIVVFAFLFQLSCPDVRGCSCKGTGTVKKSVEHADLVVSAVVLSQTLTSDLRGVAIIQGDTTDQSYRFFKYPSRVVKLKVVKLFKGEMVSDTLTIITALNGAACGVYFEVGRQYIVYGTSEDELVRSNNLVRVSVDKSVYWTHKCSRTGTWSAEEEQELMDLNTGNQRAFYECTDPLPVNSELFALRKDAVYFYFDKDLKPVNLKSKEFVWLEDNPQGYFTAYLINTSDSVLNARKQDGSLIMIQEALNEKDEWQPIEYWVRSGCGNSYFESLILKSQKYVMIPVKQYQGSYKTKIRLKMDTGKAILYSEPFEGSIDISQFEKEPGEVKGILYHGPADYLDKK